MKRVPTCSLILLSSLMMLLLSACGEEPEAIPLTTAATSSHTGAKPAVHMELKNAEGEVKCKVYDTPANARPVVETCPNGEYKEQLFDQDWNQVNQRDVVVGSSTNPGSATSPHTGASPAVHMELKELNAAGEAVGRPVCKVYDTPADTRPEVNDCPNGEYKEQLFNADWNLIDQRDVVVGSTSNPNPVTPPNAGEAPLRNPNPVFYQFEDILSDELPFNQLTEDKPAGVEIETESAGGEPRFGAGNFRVSCQYSHFSYDDPIVKPGEIDGAHLHMFFGKTNTDAFTNEDNIAESGGGTCNGFALNRSAYWTPALLDNRDKIVIPETILVYYKSSRVDPDGVARMPHGLQLLGGNIMGSAKAIKPNSDSSDVFWSCGANGADGSEGPEGPSRIQETKSGTLAELDGKCGDDEPINASIYFPQCIAEDASGNIKLKSDDDDVLSHTYRLSTKNRGEDVNAKCPASHPVRIPELAILLYYPPQTSLTGWKLSSDMMVPDAAPGSTLHADWMGGWQDDTMDLWVEECNRAKLNCTLGQTGTEDNLRRALNKESGFDFHRKKCNNKDAEENDEDCNNDDWMGPYFVTKPEKRQ